MADVTPHPLAADAAQALKGVTDGPWAFASSVSDDGQEWFGCGVMDERGNEFLWLEGSPEADIPLARFIAFARAWVPEAAAALTALSEQNSALAAQVAELTRDKAFWENRENEAVKRAEAAEAKVARLEEALRELLSAYSKPDERLCCTGHECGCQGATVQMQAEYYARAALIEGTPK